MWLTTHNGSVRLKLHIQPRASKTEIAGLHGDALKVRLAAPPVDGAANAALIRFLAEQLHVPRSAIRLVSGEASRAKVVAVDGVMAEKIRALLAL